MAKTVVGSFDRFEEAQQVFTELRQRGFRAEDISLAANNAARSYGGDDDVRAAEDDTGTSTGSAVAAGAATGGVVGGAAGLIAGLMGLAIPGVGPIIAAGPLAAALAGAGVGAVAGGLIGGLTQVGVPEADAHYYAESVRRGGAVVIVRAEDHQAEQAADVMRQFGAVDIERRVEAWRNEGWQQHDISAQPYTREDIETERSRYRAATPAHAGSAGLGVGSGLGVGLGSDIGASTARDSALTSGGSALTGGARTASSTDSPRETTTVGALTGEPTSNISQDTSMESGVGTRTRDSYTSSGARSGSAPAMSGATGGLTSSSGERIAPEVSATGPSSGMKGGIGQPTQGDTGYRSSDSTGSDWRAGSNQTQGVLATAEDDEYFRRHYGQHYGQTGASYDTYAPAYRYGDELRNNTHFRDRSWDEIEPDVRSHWEHSYPDSAWERFKGAVRHGWERTKQATESALPGDSDRDGR